MTCLEEMSRFGGESLSSDRLHLGGHHRSRSRHDLPFWVTRCGWHVRRIRDQLRELLRSHYGRDRRPRLQRVVLEVRRHSRRHGGARQVDLPTRALEEVLRRRVRGERGRGQAPIRHHLSDVSRRGDRGVSVGPRARDLCARSHARGNHTHGTRRIPHQDSPPPR